MVMTKFVADWSTALAAFVKVGVMTMSRSRANLAFVNVRAVPAVSAVSVVMSVVMSALLVVSYSLID